MEPADRQLIVRYLLGDLSDKERERLEHDYFIGDSAWQELTAVEDDLIDVYVRGGPCLSEQQRRQFQEHFLASPRRRARVEFASALMDQRSQEALAHPSPTQEQQHTQFLPEAAPRRSWWRKMAPALAFSVLLLGMLSVVSIKNWRLRTELNRTQDAQTRIQREVQSLQQELASKGVVSAPPATSIPPVPSDQLATVSLLLTSGSLRNGANPTGRNMLPLPGSPTIIVLFLALDRDEYPSYDVILKTAEGKEVLNLSGLKSKPLDQTSRAVVIKFPSQALRLGDYVVTLSGKRDANPKQAIDYYTLSAVR